MSIIRITTDLQIIMADSLGITRNNSSSLYPSMASVADSGIKIMKGAIPTESELEDAYATWNRFSGSPSDILVPAASKQATYFDGSTGTVTWNLMEGTATGTGTATWFIWHGQSAYDPQDRGAAPGAPDTTRLGCVVGTITDFSGSPLGDMILADTNIVAGQRYDFGPATFTIAREWSW